MLKNALLILLLNLLGAQSFATHMSGGEIYWECLGNGQYRIRLVVYRDCAGIAVDPTYNLVLNSPCGNRNLTVTTNGGTELSQLCALELPNSTCNGGTLPGIQQYIYTGTITLPPCNSWRISWTNIYRNNAIVNLTMPGVRQMYIEAVMNNAISPCNDSPTFTNIAVPYVCLGYPVSYSYGAIDTEADSLSYSLISARVAAGSPIPYVAPYTPAQPIAGLTLDPATGLINFTLNMAGNWVVVVLVTEYDANGNVIGSVMRDMQFIAYPCSNVPPDAATGLVSNLTGSAVQTGPRAVQVCESGDMCFDMVISDVNLTNVLTAFSNVQQNLPGSTFSYSGSNPITVSVCWTAQPGTSGFFPFIVNVNDGACPISAFQTYVYSVRVIAGLHAQLVVTNENCAGGGSGSIEALITTGTGPFSYTWSNGSSEATIFAGPGDYTVQITDANGCTSAILAGSILSGGEPNMAIAGEDIVACVGSGPIALQGSVLNASSGAWSGGGGTFSGTWPNVMYTPSAAENASGSVDLVLSTVGNGGCPPDTDQLHIDITNPFAGIAISGTNATCNGASNGTATVTPNDPTFTFAWSDPGSQSTATAIGLAAGTYSVLVSVPAGCTTTLSVTIGPSQAISLVSVTATDESCTGTGDGTATAVASGGTPPYSYTWSTGASTAGITAGNGTYTVTVTDSNGCAPASGSVTINTQGLPNQANAGPDQVGCAGTMPIPLTGTVTNATGGVWSGGTGTYAGTWPNVVYMPTAAEIANGVVMMTLTTTGNTNCPPATDMMVLALPNSFGNIGAVTTDPSCAGLANGSASVTPQGAGFSYVWNDPAAQSTATATGLIAGSYSVLITDQYGCDSTLSITLSQPIPLTASVTTTNEDCSGTANGTAVASASGGTAPYTYAWNTGASTASINGGAGTYTVNVSDANGCGPAVANGTISTTGTPNIANAGPDLIGCLNDGPITLQGTVQNATGGQWSGGTGTFTGSGLNVTYTPTTAEFINGEVTLTLTTTGNTTCSPASDAVLITLSKSFLNAALTPTAVLCTGDANGSIAFSPQSTGLSYQWSDPLGQTTGTAAGLAAGTYSVVVTDALGCDTTMSATITSPPVLVIGQLSATNILCAGASTGSINMVVQGGTAAYSISWSNGATTASQNGLPAGSYSVNITDANGCTTSGATTITQPGPMTVVVQAPDTVCVNTPTQLIASASGGAGGYVFNWGGFGYNDTVQLSFSSTRTILLTVVDQAGCSGPSTPVTVNVLDLNTATFTAYGDTTVCAGGSATIGANLSGYTGAYSISWAPYGYSGPGPFVVPVNANENVQVTVTDACGNSLVRTIGLRVNIAPTIQLPPIIAQGCAPLTVQFPTLNLGNVIYSWNLGNGNSSNVPAPLVTYGTGNYTPSLTVTTTMGCTATSTGGGLINVYAMPTAEFTASSWNVDILDPLIQFTDQSTGSIASYSWIFGDGGTSSASDPSYSFNEIGTFDVDLYIVDVNGCTSSVSHPVTVDPDYNVVIPTAFTPNPNGGGGQWVTGDLSNDVFYPFVRFVKDFRMRVFNRWGELIFESNDLNVGWDGYYRGVLSPQDVYVVQTWFRFVDGKQVEKLSDLTLFR